MDVDQFVAHYRRFNVLHPESNQIRTVMPTQERPPRFETNETMRLHETRVCSRVIQLIDSDGASEEFDAIGVNFLSNDRVAFSNSSSQPEVKEGKFYPSHFPGNFWWASGRYLSGIPVIDFTENTFKSKYDPEFWILDPYM
eukprot:gene39155-48359_t